MPSGSRGSVTTTSGSPQGQRCADGGDPARRAARAAVSTADRSPGGDRGRSPVRGRRGTSVASTFELVRGGSPASSTDLHSVVHHARRRGRREVRGSLQRRLGGERLAVRADHDVRRLAGHQVAEACAGLLADVGRVAPARPSRTPAGRCCSRRWRSGCAAPRSGCAAGSRP